jgi:hypothetical protein
VARREKSEDRRAAEFAWLLAGIGVAASGVALWRHHPLRAGLAAAGGAGAVALAFAARPLWIKLFRGWMALAAGLGWVSTRVILSVFYILDTAWHDGRASYWIEKSAIEPTIERYSKRY